RMQISRYILRVPGCTLVLYTRHRDAKKTSQHFEQQNIVHPVLIVYILIGRNNQKSGAENEGSRKNGKVERQRTIIPAHKHIINNKLVHISCNNARTGFDQHKENRQQEASADRGDVSPKPFKIVKWLHLLFARDLSELRPPPA